nr:hypothetical protein [Tanacetum cinerariifolium]
MDNKKRIVNLKYFREILHICPRLPGQTFDELPFKEEIMAFLRFLGHSGEIRKLTDNTQQFGFMLPVELTNKDIRNSKAYKEYYAIASGATPPKTKASVRKTKSSSDTTITPPNFADEGNDDDQDTDNDSDDFVHPKLSIHEKEAKNEESFDPIVQTPENSDDEGNDDASLGLNVDRQGQDAEDDDEELYRDVNINLEGRDVQMTNVHTTQEYEDTHVTLTPVNPDGQQQSSSVSSQFVTSMLNPSPDAGIDSLFETTPWLDVQASTIVAPFTLTAPTLTPPTIPTISQVPQAPTPPTTAPSTFLQDLLNFGSFFGFDHRLKTLEANFSEFVQTNWFFKAVSSILEIVERYMDQRMNEASIQRSVEQRNLYKALVDAYESDKIILDTYGDTITLKRRRDDADKDEEPFAGSDRGSKRRREGKEPESISAPKEKATKTTSKSTQGSKSHQRTVSESALAEEPMLTTQYLEDPSHQEFKTCAANDQPITKASQHPEWFQQQKKPLTPDLAWNKTLLATYESIQPWISDLAKQADSRSSFNELMDIPMDFSAFLMNRLKVDTLTLKLLAGPTYELMKGLCKSLVELEFFLKEVYKATTDQLDWNNPEGHRYPHNLLKPLPLIPNS